MGILFLWAVLIPAGYVIAIPVRDAYRKLAGV